MGFVISQGLGKLVSDHFWETVTQEFLASPGAGDGSFTYVQCLLQAQDQDQAKDYLYQDSEAEKGR